MTVSIFSLIKPPYDNYLYVSYGVTPGGVLTAFVWSHEGDRATMLSYPAEDQVRALQEIEELTNVIAATRRLLGLHTLPNTLVRV